MYQPHLQSYLRGADKSSDPRRRPLTVPYLSPPPLQERTFIHFATMRGYFTHVVRVCVCVCMFVCMCAGAGVVSSMAGRLDRNGSDHHDTRLIPFGRSTRMLSLGSGLVPPHRSAPVVCRTRVVGPILLMNQPAKKARPRSFARPLTLGPRPGVWIGGRGEGWEFGTCNGGNELATAKVRVREIDLR